MKKDNLIRFISAFACAVLIAAMMLFTSGCGQKAETASKPTAASSSGWDNAATLGKGQTSFKFTVVDDKGNEAFFIIKTDEKNVGPALEKLDLISGTVGDYGLMVETVNGVKVTYEKDGRYWAFYIDGEYASSGVDKTEIAPDKVYTFKNEKG